MKSQINARFRKAFRELSEEIRQQARDAYRQFLEDPYYPSLHFKRVNANKPLYSVRITQDYRALGVRDGDVMIWFWIGSHTDYDKLVSKF